MVKRLPTRKSNKYGYYGAVINDMFIDGAQREPSIPFGNLDQDEQKAWEDFAKQNNLDVVDFYNDEGTQIKLSRLQTFILMKLQEKYNKEVENNYDMKKENWMKNGTGPEDYGIVHVTAVGLAKEIYNKITGKQVRLVRDAITKLKEKDGFLRYYVRDPNTNKFIVRIERCSLITSYGVDISDLRIRTFNWVRLHPIFFSALKRRYIRCLDHTVLLSKYFNYELPSMPSMLLFKFLTKFGNREDNTVQIYASKLMNKVCHREFIKRQIKECREMIKVACEACKAAKVIDDYKDNIVGETGEMKYIFELNPTFFRNIKEENKEVAS